MKTGIKVLLWVLGIGLLIVSLMGILAYYFLGHQPDTGNLEIHTREICQKYLKDKPRSGIAFAICHKNLWYLGYLGKADSSAKRSLNPESVFEIGSITKVMTAELLEMLVQKGTIHWNDPVERHLPPQFRNKNPDGTRLLDLVTHTSGYPRIPETFLGAIRNECNPYTDISPEMYSGYLRNPTDKIPPDSSHFEYSNMGFALLGNVLENSTGESFEARLQTQILKPLKMNSTGTLPDLKQRMAQGFDETGKPTCPWDFPVMFSAGAVRSTLPDICLFLEAHLTTNHPIASVFQSCTKEIYPMTMGGIGKAWHHDHFSGSISGGGDIVWHNGGTGGFSSYIGFYPEKQMGLILLANQSSEGLDGLALKILNILPQISPGKGMKPLSEWIP
jgi:CubicO group peptidase (beta-lactamase class C family)